MSIVTAGAESKTKKRLNKSESEKKQSGRLGVVNESWEEPIAFEESIGEETLVPWAASNPMHFLARFEILLGCTSANSFVYPTELL